MVSTNETKKHIRTIRIASSFASRVGFVVSVVQLQDDTGCWQIPTVTFSHAVPNPITDGEYLREFGRAMVVASYWFDIFMSYVTNDDARLDENRKTGL